jgi:hypothetical protein
MGVNTKEMGGGSAKPVANEFGKMLLQGLQGGFGAVPGQAGASGGLGGYLQMLLSGQGAQGAVTQAEIAKKKAIGDLRERYSLGGTGYGTPTATAEAQYRANVDPQIANIQSQNIAQALSMILPAYQQAFGLGTPQAQLVQTPSFGANLIGGVTSLAGAAAPFLAPGIGSAVGPALGSLAQFSPDINVGKMMPRGY